MSSFLLISISALAMILFALASHPDVVGGVEVVGESDASVVKACMMYMITTQGAVLLLAEILLTAILRARRGGEHESSGHGNRAESRKLHTLVALLYLFRLYKL